MLSPLGPEDRRRVDLLQIELPSGSARVSLLIGSDTEAERGMLLWLWWGFERIWADTMARRGERLSADWLEDGVAAEERGCTPEERGLVDRGRERGGVIWEDSRGAAGRESGGELLLRLGSAPGFCWSQELLFRD